METQFNYVHLEETVRDFQGFSFLFLSLQITCIFFLEIMLQLQY